MKRESRTRRLTATLHLQRSVEMILVIVSIILAVIFFCLKKERKSAETLGSIILVAVALVISLGIGLVLPKKDVLIETETIVSLRDGAYATGTLTFGSGNVEPKIYYLFYKKNLDGELIPNKLHENIARVFEKKRDGGVVEKYHRVFQNKLLWFAGIKIPSHARYKILIPEGTLQNTFRLGFTKSGTSTGLASSF